MIDWLKACPICAATDVSLVRGTCPRKPATRAGVWTCERTPHVTGAYYVNAWNAGVDSADTGRGGIAEIANGE